jgi:hypothetical protein
MIMERIEVNVITGEQKVVPLTAEEIAEIQSRPQPEPALEPTPAQKLASIGLTVDDLKSLLLDAATTTEEVTS